MSGLINLPPLFPLAWPESSPRTAAQRRQRSQFKRPYGAARAEAENELRLFSQGGRFAITTNIPLRMSGEPDDPGVSAFWLSHKMTAPRSIAIDRYGTVRENMCALALTIKAFRTIERAGASQVLEVAMRSFETKLLPASTPAAPARPWWLDELGLALANGELSYLGTSGLVLRGRDAIDGAYWGLVPERHPDRPSGSHDAFVKLGQARDQAVKWLESP